MPSACGVTWDGTSSGTLEESEIPNDNYESHFLVDGDTKSESSFPVVDGDGNLRAGNVNSAWDLRGRGEGVSEECLRKLDAAFDDDVLPDTAYENSRTIQMNPDEQNTDGKFGMNLSFAAPAEQRLGDGFNEYGVRENDDGSIDVRFQAMEPGVRKGYEITPEFLRNTTAKSYDRIPLQMDHSDSQRANVGNIKPESLGFNDTMQVEAHVPNTGSSIRDDIIADFTHEPPQVTDISVSFDPESVEIEVPDREGAAPRFTDARIREFSLTPFPAGYENGGLTPAFSDAIESTLSDAQTSDASSNLVKRPHLLITK